MARMVQSVFQHVVVGFAYTRKSFTNSQPALAPTKIEFCITKLFRYGSYG